MRRVRNEGKVTPLPGRSSIPRWATPRISVSQSPQGRAGCLPSVWIAAAPPSRPGESSFRFQPCRPRTVVPISRPPLLFLPCILPAEWKRQQNRCLETNMLIINNLQLTDPRCRDRIFPIISQYFNKFSLRAPPACEFSRNRPSRSGSVLPAREMWYVHRL